jgi:hypothetical protein
MEPKYFVDEKGGIRLTEDPTILVRRPGPNAEYYCKIWNANAAKLAAISERGN